MIDSAVILAVSSPAFNSRLKDQRPRAMLPALGKPMVVRVMDRLYRAGIRHYMIIVGINEGPVAAYLNKQWMPDATVEFILQSNETLSLLMARIARKLERPFILAGYNSFTFERFVNTLLRQHEEASDHLILAGASMSLSPNAPTNTYAVMDGNDIVDIVSNKPSEKHFILTEHAVCGYHFIEHLKNLDDQTATDYGKTWFEIARSYGMSGEPMLKLAETSWILRIESDKDLLTLNKRMLDDSNDGHVLSELPYTTKVIPPVRIDPQVSVGQRVVIGPHVYIERGGSIGYGAKIKNAIILQKGNVPADSDIDSAIVTSRDIIDIE